MKDDEELLRLAFQFMHGVITAGDLRTELRRRGLTDKEIDCKIEELGEVVF